MELDAGQVLHHGVKPKRVQEDILDEVIKSEDQLGAEVEDSPAAVDELELSAGLTGNGTATSAYSPDPEPDLAEGKLIEAEVRAEGRVSVRTYLTYIYAAGVWCWIMSLIIMLIIRLIGIGNQVGDRTHQVPVYANRRSSTIRYFLPSGVKHMRKNVYC